jgi:integrase
MLFRPSYSRVDPKTGRKRKRKLKKWYVRYRTPDGTVKTVPGHADKEATRQLEARLLREAAREQEGMVNPFAEHAKRPLAEHLADFCRALEAKGDTADHARHMCTCIRTLLDGCRFVRIADVQASPVAEWLAGRRKEGMAARTSNYYLVAVKGFLKWLVRDGRTDRNPLDHLSGLNTKVDVRRSRRTLPDAEFAAFVAAARLGKPFRELAGPERAVLYLVAVNTGFRASELASLTPESFDLDALPPTATVGAAYSKHRRTDVQPIRADLAALLRDWLKGKPAGQPLWPGKWKERGGDMVRLDLEAAGIAYYAADGRVFDFHAIRHQFISNLAAAGVHPKVAQTLARHSSITLTMDRYTHLALSDQTAALDSLPALPTNTTGLDREAATLAATGTDGPAHALPHTCAADVTRLSLTRPDTSDGESENPPSAQEPREIRLSDRDCGCMTRPDMEGAAAGGEGAGADYVSLATAFGMPPWRITSASRSLAASGRVLS